MNIGYKAQGHTSKKEWVQRHGSKRGASRNSYHAAEKAAEVAVRQQGRKVCRAEE